MSADPLVLASSSPRRRHLLHMLGISHVADPPGVDETALPDEDPAEHVIRLAVDKAIAVARRYPDRFVLAADTVVVLDSELLGKPSDEADAVAMLQRLCGRRHEVVTGVALYRAGEVATRLDRTAVWLRDAGDAEIGAYVASQEPLDKAGAYAAQGLGGVFVDRIEGDFYSVMGLPIRLVVDLLAEAGVPYRFGR